MEYIYDAPYFGGGLSVRIAPFRPNALEIWQKWAFSDLFRKRPNLYIRREILNRIRRVSIFRGDPGAGRQAGNALESRKLAACEIGLPSHFRPTRRPVIRRVLYRDISLMAPYKDTRNHRIPEFQHYRPGKFRRLGIGRVDIRLSRNGAIHVPRIRRIPESLNS